MCCHVFLLEGKVSVSLDDSIRKRRRGAMLWLLDVATTHSFPLPRLKPYLLNFIYLLSVFGGEGERPKVTIGVPSSVTFFFEVGPLLEPGAPGSSCLCCPVLEYRHMLAHPHLT